MNYNPELITSKADINELLSYAREHKESLKHKKYMEERQEDRITDISNQLNQQLFIITAEKNSYENTAAGLPEGVAKNAMEERIYKLEYSQHLIQTQLAKTGAARLLQARYTLSCLEKSLEENDKFIEVLEKRRVEL